MEADIFPHLGFKAIDSISAPELLKVLRLIESRDAIDIAHRALQVCGQIFLDMLLQQVRLKEILQLILGARLRLEKKKITHGSLLAICLNFFPNLRNMMERLKLN